MKTNERIHSSRWNSGYPMRTPKEIKKELKEAQDRYEDCQRLKFSPEALLMQQMKIRIAAVKTNQDKSKFDLECLVDQLREGKPDQAITYEEYNQIAAVLWMLRINDNLIWY